MQPTSLTPARHFASWYRCVGATAARGFSNSTALTSIFVAIVLTPVALAAASPLSISEIAPGVFVYQGPHEDPSPANGGGISNLGFVVGDSSVAVIDTGGSPSVGRRLRAAVRTVTNLPISHIVITHAHPDHMLGTTAFERDDAAIVAHHLAPGAVAMRGPFYVTNLARLTGEAIAVKHLVAPTVLVTDTLDIDLGNRTLRVQAYETAHTDNDVSVLDRQTGTLFMGDLLFMERIPVVDGSLKGWLKVLQQLKTVDVARVVPGHGPRSAPWPEAVEDQIRYLRLLLERVREAVSQGLSIGAAASTVGVEERKRWLLHDSNHERNVTASYAELEWE